MDRSNDNAAMADAPIFEALLVPHRSLSPRGFVILMAVVGVISVCQSMAFALFGGWPIIPFLGLDVAILGGAFWLNYRAARAREEITVSRTNLSIRKFSSAGRLTEHRFNPFWARLKVLRHDEIGITGMHVVGEGRSTDIGSFLNPDDRESFARAFAGALAQARSG